MKREAIEEEVRGSGAIGRVSLVTFVSRILGLVREQVKAVFFGTSHAADAFNVAFMLPNLLRRFLAEGVTAAAVVPVMTDTLRLNDPREARRLAAVLLGAVCSLAVIVVSAGVLLAPAYVPLLFPRYSEEKRALACLLTQIMFPYIGFVSLASLLQGILNCHAKFSLPAFCPVVLNIVVIACALLWAPYGRAPETQAQAARVMAWGILAGGVLQAAFLAPAVIRLGYRLAPAWDLRHPGLRRVGSLFVPVIIGGGIHQLNAVVALVLAGLLPEGGPVSALQYSNRLLELALGVFVVSVTTVSLPGLSRLWSENRARYLEHTAFVMRLVLLIAAPAGAGLLFLRREIISCLFVGGSFGRTSLELTATALLYHAASVPLTACCRLFAQAFYAARDSRTPLRMGIIMALVNMALCAALLLPLGHGGIALAMTLSGAAGVVSYAITWRRLHGPGALGGTAAFAARAAAASLAMGAFHMAWSRGVFPFPETASRAIQVLHLAGALCLDAAFYFAALRIFGERHLRLYLATLVRRR